MDKLVNRHMFKPTEGKSRVDLAANEACKTKRLLGSLRNLWRSSAEKGHDDRVTHLKSLLVPSPTRGRRGAQAEEGEEEVQREASPEFVPVRLEDSSDEGEKSGSEEEQKEGSDAEEPESGNEASSEAEAASSQESSSVDTLTAPTVHLGESSDDADAASSSESLQRDSQIPGRGWMGRAIMAHNAVHLDKERKQNKRREEAISILKDIRWELKSKCEGDEEELAFDRSWDEYKGFCFQALIEHGADAWERLADISFFNKWYHSMLSGKKVGSATRDEAYRCLLALGLVVNDVSNSLDWWFCTFLETCSSNFI